MTPSTKGPSRYRSTITNTWNGLKPQLDQTDQKIDDFNSINDIDKLQYAADILRRFKDKLVARHDSIKNSLKNWNDAITAESKDDTEKDNELQTLENYLTLHGIDETDLESKVTMFISEVTNTIKSKMDSMQMRSTLCGLKAKQVEIETEAAIRKNALEKDMERDKEVKEEIREKQRQSFVASLQSPSYGTTSFPSASGDSPQIVQVQCSADKHTLPPLSLPKFDGSPWKYSEFMERFTSMIDCKDNIDTTEKHTYLRMCLEGEAKNAVKQIPLTKDFYEAAKKRLKDSFYRPLACKLTLLQRLTDLSCNRSSWQSQLDMTREAYALVNELISIRDGDKMETAQLQLIRKYSDKLQEHIFKKLKGRETQGQEPLTIIQTIETIETYLIDKIDIQCSLQTYNRSPSDSKSHERRPHTNNRDNRSASFSYGQANTQNTPSNRNHCLFCNSNHYSANCDKSKEEKWEGLKSKKLCGRCLQGGHQYSTCRSRCQKCNLKHHEYLCDQSEQTNTSQPANATPNRSNGTNPRRGQTTPVQSANNDQRNTQNVASIQIQESAEQTVASLSAVQKVTSSSAQILTSLIKKPQLFLAKVTVVNPISKQEKQVDCFIDPGAQPTVITEALAKDLDLPVIATVEVDIVVPGAMKLVNRVYDYSEVLLKCENTSLTLRTARFKHDITCPIQKRALSEQDKDYVRKHKLHLSDSPNREALVTPSLLIGMEDAAKLFAMSKRRFRSLPSGLILQQSGIGYLVGGSPNDSQSTVPTTVQPDYRTTNHDKRPDIQLNFLSLNTFEARVEKYLGLDEAGQGIETTEREIRKQEDIETDKYFDDTVYKDGSHYVVKYRLKDNWQELPDNRQLAYRRLESEVRKLKGNQHYLEHYDKIFQEQLIADQIEVVDEKIPTSHLVHYLAHSPVLRPDKPTTPLRVVYDASAKLKGKICLNDAIYQGPNGLEQIPALLLRVRSKKNLIIADVEKAFLQVRVHESQRDMLRFIWMKDKSKGVTKDNLITYRFKVTPFGVNQSPYILGKVIQHHLKSIETADPTELYILSQLTRNIYVDNVLFCADDAKPEYYDTSKKIFNEMGMNLREYISNDQSFNAFIASSDKGKDSEQKLLGILWDPASDTFKLKSKLGDAGSKRKALSEVASQYDPLGWLGPLILKGKLFIQDLWKQNLKWDDSIRPELKNKWESVKLATEGLTVAIPRYCNLDGPIIRLVMFSDASKSASGACIYNGNPTAQTCRLMISRNRLAPKKYNSTIPKLELEGCIIGCNLIQYTVEALSKEHPNSQIHIFPFCDSTIAIHWLSAETQHALGPYVINRVKKYKKCYNELTESGVKVHPLRYVNTKDNPADFLTRGLDASDLNNPSHPWWTGPHWLSKDQSEWPQTILPSHHDEMTLCTISWADTRPQVEQSSPKTQVIDTFRFSTLNRLLKTAIWIRRYMNGLKEASLRRKSGSAHFVVQNAPSQTHSSFSTAEERKQAFLTLVRIHQSCNYVENSELAKGNHVKLDEYGVWRGNNERVTNVLGLHTNPIFLPGNNSHLPELLCLQVHLNLNHAGVNTIVNEMKREYWIPRIRSIAKRVANQCINCRKANNFPYKYPEAVPLPDERTHHVRPFENTGLDFIGPFKDKQDQNIYILLLTCFSTRAVHLEVVNSMSTTSMTNALKRFVSRRGRPLSILSDKAPTFRTADEMLKKLKIQDSESFQQEIADQGIQWKFTTAHAPWQGGLYERLVGCVKKAMTKSIGRKKLSNEDFNTLACEIEASVNCRPLTYSGSDNENSYNPSVIRPIDFLCPGVSLGLRFDTSSDEYIPRSEITTRDQVLKQLHRNETMVENMISIWKTSYIATLRDSAAKNALQSYRASKSEPRVGEVVLIVDESGNTPKSTWPLAVIEKINGHSIGLRTAGGRAIERPHNLLISLELSSNEAQTKYRGVKTTTTNGLNDQVHRHSS